MSFKLFLQGKTPEEIKHIKAQKDYVEDPARERKRKEALEVSEKLARSVQESSAILSELERKAWQRLTGQRRLPKLIW